MSVLDILITCQLFFERTLLQFIGVLSKNTLRFLGEPMILFRIKELIAEKERRENRKISVSEVARHTGVNRTSLSKMQNPAIQHSTTTNAIEALCRYFDCKVEDVMVYQPDDK